MGIALTAATPATPPAGRRETSVNRREKQPVNAKETELEERHDKEMRALEARQIAERACFDQCRMLGEIVTRALSSALNKKPHSNWPDRAEIVIRVAEAELELSLDPRDGVQEIDEDEVENKTFALADP